jgi:hypothetical protein
MPSPIEIFFSYSHKEKRLRVSKMLAFSGLPCYTTNTAPEEASARMRDCKQVRRASAADGRRWLIARLPPVPKTPMSASFAVPCC